MERKPKIVTKEKLALANRRDDNSISFTSAGRFDPPKDNDMKVKIVATEAGELWLQPANGQAIDLMKSETIARVAGEDAGEARASAKQASIGAQVASESAVLARADAYKAQQSARVVQEAFIAQSENFEQAINIMSANKPLGGTFDAATGVATLTRAAKLVLGIEDDKITLSNEIDAKLQQVFFRVAKSGDFSGLGLMAGDDLVATDSGWQRAPSPEAISGVKGSAETTHRTGFVTISKRNIDFTGVNQIQNNEVAADIARVNQIPTSLASPRVVMRVGVWGINTGGSLLPSTTRVFSENILRQDFIDAHPNGWLHVLVRQTTNGAMTSLIPLSEIFNPADRNNPVANGRRFVLEAGATTTNRRLVFTLNRNATQSLLTPVTINEANELVIRFIPNIFQ